VTPEQFEALVRRLEPQARANPTGYARRVALLAGLGYAFIALALAFLVALAGVVVALALAGRGVLLKLLLPIGALGWVIHPRSPSRLSRPRESGCAARTFPSPSG
jgi:hypothetical protein